MLSKAAISRIAEELLDQARASRVGFTDPSGVPVPPIYRNRDMAVLPPGLQLEIVNKANWAVGTSAAFILLVLALLGMLVLAYALAPLVLGISLPFPAMVLFVPLVPLVQVGLARWMARRIARLVAVHWPVPVPL